VRNTSIFCRLVSKTSVINWVLGVGADVIEKTMQSGEYGNDRATAQLEKA